MDKLNKSAPAAWRRARHGKGGPKSPVPCLSQGFRPPNTTAKFFLSLTYISCGAGQHVALRGLVILGHGKTSNSEEEIFDAVDARSTPSPAPDTSPATPFWEPRRGAPPLVTTSLSKQRSWIPQMFR